MTKEEIRACVNFACSKSHDCPFMQAPEKREIWHTSTSTGTSYTKYVYLTDSGKITREDSDNNYTENEVETSGRCFFDNEPCSYRSRHSWKDCKRNKLFRWLDRKDKKMAIQFKEGNAIIYDQDFALHSGIDHGVEFQIAGIVGNAIRLIGPNHGGKPYGNGAIYVRFKTDGNPKRKEEKGERFIAKEDIPVGDKKDA